jgi:putative oxidoreductase
MAESASSTGLPVITKPPPTLPPLISGLLTLAGLAAAVYVVATAPATRLSLWAGVSLAAWLALSLAFTFLLTPRHFTLGFLAGLGALLIGWRVAALNDLRLVSWVLLPAFLAFVAQFFLCVLRDRRSTAPVMSEAGWTLTFIRLYIGFDMVPHFAEKLFGGPASFQADVAVFTQLGYPMPAFFVLLGGFCEFGIMVGFGLGLFTRAAAFGAALYFLVATWSGGHFGNGFIWANGGWEYSALMMALYLAFAWIGAGAFSFDRALLAGGRLPRVLVPLSVRRARPRP